MATLFIYTLSPLNEEMKKAMMIPQSSEIMPTVPNDIVVETMKNADILVHVEPLDEKDRLF